MSYTKTYDPKQFPLNFAGIPLSGFADGTFISVEFDEDAFTKMTGADGSTVRVLNNNRGAKVTVTLMQHSQCNDSLSAIHAQDRLTGQGVGILQGKELNGTSRIFGEAWIQKTPNMERAKEASNVVWVFDMPDAEGFVGGLI